MGFQIGGFIDYSITDNLFVRANLLFITKGASRDFEMLGITTKTTMNPMYLQLPILIGYGFDITDSFKLYANIGPYFAYGLGGKTTTKISGSVIDSKNDIDYFNDNNSNFDFGARFGIGIELIKSIIIEFDYDLGLTNLNTSSTSDDYSSKNYTMGLTIGYKF